MSFVTNPLLQSKVVEVGLATLASDHEVIIELSGKLQKTAATLTKKSKNNH
jgi:hypothetical protein